MSCERTQARISNTLRELCWLAAVISSGHYEFRRKLGWPTIIQTLMMFLHASTKDFSQGELLVAEPTQFYVDAVVELEKGRPIAAPLRSTCVFAAQTHELPLLFLLRQGVPLDAIRLYEVEIVNNWSAPMALVHAIARKLQNGKDVASAVREYWRPSLKWNFHEAFGPEMTIIKAAPIPTLNADLLKIRYQLDFDQAFDIN
jgi:hypothetical protein